MMNVDNQDVNSIFAMALLKLRGPRGSDPALAILSQRFALDVSFGHPDAVSYVEKEIASHLRICYATTKDRTWSFTGYPSEPLVSCAAAHILHENTTYLWGALEALRTKVDEGLFEIGQSGELTSRLLLLLAKDTYVRKNLPENSQSYTTPDEDDKWRSDLIDCQQVSIVKFLEYLFGESFWTRAGHAAKEAFHHAYINFSHWTPLDEPISHKSKDGYVLCIVSKI